MKSMEYFEEIFYGGHGKENYIVTVEDIFASGWNAALEELIRKINNMPISKKAKDEVIRYSCSLIHDGVFGQTFDIQ